MAHCFNPQPMYSGAVSTLGLYECKSSILNKVSHDVPRQMGGPNLIAALTGNIKSFADLFNKHRPINPNNSVLHCVPPRSRGFECRPSTGVLQEEYAVLRNSPEAIH